MVDGGALKRVCHIGGVIERGFEVSTEEKRDVLCALVCFPAHCSFCSEHGHRRYGAQLSPSLSLLSAFGLLVC